MNIFKKVDAKQVFKSSESELDKRELLYSIFDSVSGAFNFPFVMASDGLAIRAFADSVRSRSGNLSRYPEEYALWKIGYFDAVSGSIESITPVHLADAVDFVVRGPQSDDSSAAQSSDDDTENPPDVSNSNFKSTEIKDN